VRSSCEPFGVDGGVIWDWVEVVARLLLRDVFLLSLDEAVLDSREWPFCIVAKGATWTLERVLDSLSFTMMGHRTLPWDRKSRSLESSVAVCAINEGRGALLCYLASGNGVLGQGPMYSFPVQRMIPSSYVPE
jgi:hypothetical protein